MTLRVLSAGPRTSFQDLGRHGWAAHGVPPSGAMDPFALRTANLLVGNVEDAACLEFTLVGPTLRAEQDVVVAVVGSERAAEATVVRAGEAFDAGRAVGARGYVAVHGGFAVEPVLGSRSTYVTAVIGPALPRAGDVVPVGTRTESATLRRLRRDDSAGDSFVRVTRGSGVDVVLDVPLVVGARADRVGVRFDTTLPPAGVEAVPVGVPRGAIQLPDDGHPIVICADGPITGGYPQIATVIAADIGIVGQARPGDTLRFMAVDVEQARAAWHARLDAVRAAVEVIP